MPPPSHDTRRACLRVFCLTAAALAAGCAVGPDFERPEAPATDRYTMQPLPAQTTSTPVAGGEAQALRIGEQLPERWWLAFESPQLNALIDEAFANSPTVTSAQATLRQAQELLRARRGDQWPTVDVGVGAERSKSFMNFGEPGVIGPLNMYNAGVSVGYGVDVFGGLRRQVEAQGAQVDLRQYELQATYLALAGNVVAVSVQEASLRGQLDAMHAMIAAQEQRLALAEKQYELGASAYAEVLSARSELASLRADLAPLQQALATAQSQLAVYLGKLPGERAHAPFSLADLKLPQDLPLGVPSELVRRRPDVLAAEATLHRTSAEIGVATANLLPQLTLNASYGGQSNQFSNLFDNPIWSIGANLAQPLFHGGSLTAQRRAAIAAFDAARADYRQTVLNAFKNVADSLQAVLNDAEALNARHVAQQSADESLQLIDTQYRLGGASYVALLVAQRQAQQARIEYVRSLGNRYQDTAALMYALSGGWSPDMTRQATNGDTAINDNTAINENTGGGAAAPATQE